MPYSGSCSSSKKQYYNVSHIFKAYFGGQGRRYYVQHCATLASDSKKSIMLRWAKLGDIGRIDCQAKFKNWVHMGEIRRPWPPK
jgi:hypothetical protein